MRLEKRADSPLWLNLLLPLAAVTAALVLCSGLIAMAGANPIAAYWAMFSGALGTRFNLVETLALSIF